MKASTEFLNKLSVDLLDAKDKAAIAAAWVIACEQAIINAIGTAGDEGTQTDKTDQFKVTVVTGYNYSLDTEQVHLLKNNSACPPALFDSVFKEKRSLDLKTFRALQGTNPEKFDLIVRAVTAKPKKTAVKVTALEI
tara:strand:+ start:9232 stop:9642 length:411 start_codon:yes stop_codon:yes gene_type:complete